MTDSTGMPQQEQLTFCAGHAHVQVALVQLAQRAHVTDHVAAVQAVIEREQDLFACTQQVRHRLDAPPLHSRVLSPRSHGLSVRVVVLVPHGLVRGVDASVHAFVAREAPAACPACC